MRLRIYLRFCKVLAPALAQQQLCHEQREQRGEIDVERRPVQSSLLHVALPLGAASAAALVEAHRALRVAVDVDDARLGRYRET